MTSRPLRRIGLALAGAVLLGLATALPASAHVRADGTATVGGWAVITFRVPTESDTASTVALTLTMPSNAQFSSVSTLVKPGWKVSLERADLATPTTDDDGNKITTYVKSVTWTATGDGIKPGEFDTFAISVGPVPDVDTLVFPSLQTYSDGTKVNWSEISQSGAEPEHPAPAVTVVSAQTATATASADHHGTDASATGPGSNTLGVAGVVLGALALVLAGVALVRGSGRTSGK